MEGEEDRPYRRITLEWYRDLEAGTFLLKLVAEGEGVKGGRREATFTLSADALDMTKSVTLDDLINAAVGANNIDESSLANRIAVTLANLLSLNGINDINVATDAYIDMIGFDARELMAFDAIKLKMALSGEKS
ncbi:MAG: hypothetical protein RXO24_07400 [Acidilobus sp.]